MNKLALLLLLLCFYGCKLGKIEITSNDLMKCRVFNNYRILGKLEMKIDIKNAYFNNCSKKLFIAGNIKDFVTNEPLSDVKIRLIKNQVFDSIQLTDSLGYFHFKRKISNYDTLQFRCIGMEEINIDLKKFKESFLKK